MPGEGNPWAYKTTVPPLPDSDKLTKDEVLQIECHAHYKIRSNVHIMDEESANNEVFRMFREMLAQEVPFMCQWVRVFVLTHK